MQCGFGEKLRTLHENKQTKLAKVDEKRMNIIQKINLRQTKLFENLIRHNTFIVLSF